MRRYLVFAAVVVTALLVGVSELRNVQSAATATPAEISVTADGVVHAQPDTARL